MENIDYYRLMLIVYPFNGLLPNPAPLPIDRSGSSLSNISGLCSVIGLLVFAGIVM